MSVEQQDAEEIQAEQIQAEQIRRAHDATVGVSRDTIPLSRALPGSHWRRPHAFAPRARTRIAGSMIALLLLVLANLAVQLDRRAWDVASDGYFSMRRVQACESLGRVPDVLYSGSSLSVYGISPARVDAEVRDQFGRQSLGCNVGMLGATFEQDYYMLKRMIEDGYAPKLVVETLWAWNINTHAVPTADQSTDRLTQIAWVADLSDASALAPQYPAGAQRTSAMLDFTARKVIPLYGDREGLRAQLCGESTLGPCSAVGVISGPDRNVLLHADRQGWAASRGFSLAQLSPAEFRSAPATRWQYLWQLMHDFTIGGHQADYLARLIALAHAHGTQVALVMTPMNTLLHSYLTHPSDWARIQAYWRGFASAHQVSLYDASLDPGFGNADFFDPQHLNATGAEKFSTQLGVHVVGPALTGRSPA